MALLRTLQTVQTVQTAACSAAACVVCACAGPPVTTSVTTAVTTPVTAPDVPAPLRPPAGQAVYLQALATGVQIYDCAPRAGQPGSFEWTFRAPEAALTDPAGTALGKHYAGPTWEAPDGSTVVGEVRARDPGPDASAIPWLLLGAKSNTGAGIFTPARSIQRVRTAGGVVPSAACTAANAAQQVRVPYTAAYFFYRAAP